MNWPTRLLAVLVLGIVASLVAVVSRRNLSSPREVLESVQLELQKESYDEQALLRRLASSLRRAEAGDLALEATRQLCADLRLTRGELYLDIGATREARADFEAVLENYRPDDREVRRLLIRAESTAGETEVALAHLDELLREQPDYGSAMVEKGHLHQELAQRALARCDEKLAFVLVEADAEQASKILRTLASRDPADPARATIILELKELFPASADESLGQVLGFCEEASGHLTACREAYVRSFALGLDPVALTRYLEILEAAGRSPEALRLGSIVALEGPERADPQSALLLIRMLLERGNAVQAAQVAVTWLEADQPLGADFLRLACEALYRGEVWQELSRCSYRLRSIGTLEDEDVCSFYTGMSQANAPSPKIDRALIALMDFATARTPEPFDGARQRAWRQIAILRQERGELTREREAIQAALEMDPPNAGALWLRLAEIQLETPHNGYRLPLDTWAMGMSLMPRAASRLLERFLELGELTLEAEERNIEVIFEELARSGRKFPSRDYGPYVLYRIAQMHGEQGNWSGQYAAAQRLLDKLPGFLPALDLVIEARQELADRDQFIEAVLERVELTGMDERADELVSAIRQNEYTHPQLVRMMKADPRNTGRMVVTRWLYENGENQAAIQTLESAARSKRTDEEYIFGARILMAEGDYRQALRWLDSIEDGSSLAGTRLRLAVNCALSLGKTDEILARLRELHQNDPPGPEELLLLTDGCLQVDQVVAARVLLEGVELQAVSEPGAVRRREVLLALREDDEDAPRTIERSAPFLSEAEYLVARLQLHARHGDWTHAARDAQDLARTDLGASPLVQVLVDLVAGEEARAAESTRFGLALTPLVPRWILADNIARLAAEESLEVSAEFGTKSRADLLAFLQGRGDVVTDPREVAALLLAAELPSFQPYVLATLHEMQATERGVLWRNLLEAELQSEAGDDVGAVPTYDELLRSHSDCLPAWDALELAQARNYGSTTHPQVARVRNRRLLALAQADREGAAALLIEAHRLKLRGDLQGALRSTLNARQLAPDWFETRIAVAEAYSDLAHWEPALEEWRALVESSDATRVTRSVSGYLQALGRASRTDPPVVQVSQIKEELKDLDARHPDDPRVVLALAHIDLLIDESNPAFGLERAWSRLRTMRDRFEGRSLESMQRGATLAWANFYTETDPDSAEEFLLSELHRQPGNLYLWRLLGRVYRDLGRFEDSIDILGRVSLMAPSEEVQLELGASYAAQGADPSLVERSLQRAASLSAEEEEPLRARLLRAASQLATYDLKAWASAIEGLEAIWEGRHQLEDPQSRVRLASLLGRALLLRGERGDARRAANVLQAELEGAAIPYQREEFNCLIGLGNAIAAQERGDDEPLSEPLGEAVGAAAGP